MSHADVDVSLSSYVPGVHAIRDGHVIRAGAVVPALRGRDPEQTLWVGPFTTVQGTIQHAGSVMLARGSVTWDGIRAGLQVVIGADCTVDGPIHCDGNVVVQDGAKVRGAITAGSDVHLLGKCHVQDVTCQGDVFITGAPQTGALTPSGRIQTRSW